MTLLYAFGSTTIARCTFEVILLWGITVYFKSVLACSQLHGCLWANWLLCTSRCLSRCGNNEHSNIFRTFEDVITGLQFFKAVLSPAPFFTVGRMCPLSKLWGLKRCVTSLFISLHHKFRKQNLAFLRWQVCMWSKPVPGLCILIAKLNSFIANVRRWVFHVYWWLGTLDRHAELPRISKYLLLNILTTSAVSAVPSLHRLLLVLPLIFLT